MVWIGEREVKVEEDALFCSQVDVAQSYVANRHEERSVATR